MRYLWDEVHVRWPKWSVLALEECACCQARQSEAQGTKGVSNLAVPVRKQLVGQQLLKGAGCWLSQPSLELLTGQMDRHATGICGVDGMVAEPSVPWGI